MSGRKCPEVMRKRTMARDSDAKYKREEEDLEEEIVEEKRQR